MPGVSRDQVLNGFQLHLPAVGRNAVTVTETVCSEEQLEGQVSTPLN